jgi:hypothetical protein
MKEYKKRQSTIMTINPEGDQMFTSFAVGAICTLVLIKAFDAILWLFDECGEYMRKDILKSSRPK